MMITWLETSFYPHMVSVLSRKNHDYTPSKADPLDNFRRVESLGICSLEEGILVRISDKVARLAALLGTKDAEVSDESLFDTASDLVGYASILAYALAKKKGDENEDPD